MFQNMCTILRENLTPNLKTHTLLRSCHLWVPWSVAASSLTILFRRHFNHDIFEIKQTCSTNLVFVYLSAHYFKNDLCKVLQL
jgi:hypothetical protein